MRRGKGRWKELLYELVNGFQFFTRNYVIIHLLLLCGGEMGMGKLLGIEMGGGHRCLPRILVYIDYICTIPLAGYVPTVLSLL